MPTIGSKRVQQSDVVTFAPMPTASSSTGVASFTLQAPSTGTQLYETYSNVNGAVTLGLRSISVNKGLVLTVNQGVIYLALDTAALSLSLLSDSPTFTGVPHAPTAPPGTNTTQIATTQYVIQSRDSPAFTGIPTAPTANSGNSTTQLATTQFVATNFTTRDSPVLIGSPTAPTGDTGDNSTRIATDAFVHTATSGVYTLNVASGLYALTPIQYGNKTIILAGALSGNVSVVFPNIGHWVVINRTSANFTVGLTLAGSTGVVIDYGSNAVIVADGTNLVFGNLAITQQIADSSTKFATTEFVHNVLGTNSGGIITITTQGGLITLTPSQALAETILVAYGATTESSSVTLIVPNTGSWIVSNRLASHVVTVKTAAGTGISLNVGSTAYVVADGTNVITTQTLQADTVAVTQPVGDNSTAIATTAFVKNQGYAAKAGDSFTGKVNMTASGLALSVTNNAQILGTLTLGNLAITTINASGAVSFTGSGIALNVTNDVTIGGLLHVLGTSGYSSFDTTLIANGDLLCTGSGYLKLPSGTTVQRPNPGDPASIRYNATTGRPEFGVGGNWTNFIKLSGDTMTGPLTTTAITATGTISGKTILGTDKGQANGYAPLDVNAKVPWVNLPVADRTFMLPFFFSGKPTSHQIYNFVIPSAMQLAENFAGTVVYDSTSTTNPAVFAVNKISGGVTTPIGTITVGPASNTALTLSTQLAVSFVTGDVLQMVAPLIVDETLSDVAFTMMATGVTTILPVDVPLQVFGVSAIGNFGQIKLIFSPIIPALGVVGVSKVTNVIIPRFASPAVVGKTGTGNVGTMATIFTHRQVLDGVAGISGVTTPAIYFSRGALLVGKAASGGVGNLASAASAGNTANVVGKAATADVGNLPIPAERATPVGAGRAGSLGNVIKFVQINPVGQTGVGGFGGTPMLNPLDCDPAITIGAGNFANNNTDGLHSIRGTRGITAGKYCFEVLIVNTGVSPNYAVGVSNKSMAMASIRLGSTAATGVGFYLDGSILPFAPTSGNPLTYLTQILVAVDADRKKIWVFDPVAGIWNQDAFANPATGVNGISLVATLAGGAIYPTWTTSQGGDASYFSFGPTFANATQFAATGFGIWPINLSMTSGLAIGVQTVGQVGNIGLIRRDTTITMSSILANGKAGTPDKITINPGSAAAMLPQGTGSYGQLGNIVFIFTGSIAGISGLGSAGSLTIQNPGYALVAQTSMPAQNTATTTAIDTSNADLIVVCQTQYSGAQIAILSDNLGNTWTGTTARTTSVAYVRIYYCRPTTVGVNHTFTVTAPGGNTFGTLQVAAFRGSRSSPFDLQNGATSTSASVMSAGSVTPNSDNSLIVTGLCATDGSSGMQVSPPFTISNSINWVSGSNESGALAYYIQPKSATINPSWNWTGASHGAASVVVFTPGTTLPGVWGTAQVGSVTGYLGSGPALFDDNFIGSLPGGWTYTRADAVATNSTYLDDPNVPTYTIYATNQARILPFGLLMEPSRTNYFLNSEAPKTTTNLITLALGTYTLWFLGVSGTQILTFSNTAVISPNNSTIYPGVPFTFQVTTAGSIYFILNGSLIRVQIENGPNATSYIMSGPTAVTRTEERLQRNFLGGELNVNQGTYWVEWMSAQSSRTSGLHSMLMTAGNGSYSSSSNMDLIRSDDFIATTTFAEAATNIGSNSFGQSATLVKPPGNVSRIAYSVSLHKNQIAADNILDPRQVTDVGARPPSLLTITLGGGGATDPLNQPMNGYLRGFKYWPVAMPDMELQSKTIASGPSVFDFDFTQAVLPRGLSFIRPAPDGGVTDSFYTDTPGSTYNSFAGTNTPRLLGSRGLLLEASRFNAMPFSASPTTRATTGLVVGNTYCAWIIGTGSITLSNGTGTLGTVQGPNPVVAGQLTYFTMAVAGNVTVIVTGSVNRVQIEYVSNLAGSFGVGPSSFIDVPSNSSASHPAEYVSMPVKNWYNLDQGTYYLEITPESHSIGNQFLMSCASSASVSEQIYLFMPDQTVPMTTTAGQSIWSTGSLGNTASTPNLLPGVTHRIAYTLTTITNVLFRCQIAVDGMLGVAGNFATNQAAPPYPTTFYLNYNSSGDAGNHFFRHARYYDYMMTDAQLQQLTSIVDVPALDLLLMGPALDPRITFTRSSIATYFDSTGTLQTASANAPRFDYDPMTLKPLGLLVELTRTNLIPNPRGEGAVVGSPGTDATGWSTNSVNVTRTIALGVEGGLPYTQYRQQNAAAPTVNLNFVFSAPSTASLPVTANGIYTFSLYISFTAGTFASFSNFYLRLNQYDSGGTPLTTLLSNFPLSGMNIGDAITKTRVSAQFTVASNAAFVQPFLQIPVVAGPLDFTVRIAGMQLELGSQVSSVILPPVGAPAAQTRIGEIITVSPIPWFNAIQSTLEAEYMIAYSTLPAGSGYVSVELDDGSSNNLYQLRNRAGTGVEAGVFVAGSSTGNGIPGSFAPNTVMKHAATFDSQARSIMTTLNGVTPISFTFTSAPTGINRLAIGCGRTAAIQGWMRRVRYWPTLLSNADLQNVTAATSETNTALPGVLATAQVGSMYIGSGLPTVDDNFVTSQPGGWAYTRADTVATDCTYLDGSTVATYTTFNTNQPRLMPFGLLMEPSRTNYFLNSEAPSVGSKTITLALGTYTMWYLGAPPAMFVTAGTAVMSPTTGNATPGVPYTFQVTTAGTVSVSVLSNVLRVQVENGPDATSYILSGATAVTRAEERLSQNFFGGQLNASQGTYWVEFMLATASMPPNPAAARLFTAGGGSFTSNNNTDQVFFTNTGSNAAFGSTYNASGGGVTTTFIVPPKVGNVSRAAMSVSPTRNQIAMDYVLGTASPATYRPPSLLAVTLGNGGNPTGAPQAFNGYIRGFKYWPVAMGDFELQACTGAGYFRSAPIVDLDFTTGVWPRRTSFTRTATTGTVTDSFYTDAPGSTYNTFAGLNTPRYFGSKGVLLEASRSNYFPVSAAPITRPSASLTSAATWCAWMIGTGSITLSNGTGTIGTVQGSLTVTTGQITKFSMATTGTINVTVNGSVNRVQIEAMSGNLSNAFALGPSSFVGVASTVAQYKGGEYLTMPISNWHNIEQHTYYVEFIPEDIGWQAWQFIMSITFSANAREQIFLVVSDVTVPNSNVICAGEMILPTDAEGFASYAAQSSIAPNVPHKIATAVSTLPTGIIQGKVAVDGVIGNPPSRGIYTPPLPYPTNLYLNFSPAGGTGNHYFIRARYWDYKLTESELMAVTRGPSLDISLSNTLDPRITYNRASTGTYFDMNGILQTAVNNQPRFDYDPATQVARGLLIEEQRINTMFPSVYGTGWSVAGSGTVDTNISIAPDGTNTAVRITADAVNNPHGFQQSQRVARASSTTYTTSIFAKAGTTSKISLSFRTGADWVNGTIPTASFDLAAVTASPSGGASATIVPINNGWYRLTVTATTAASAPTGNLIWVFPLNAAGQDTYTGAGENAYFWGWQVEVGQFASSYIPTSAATVTRVADVVMMPTSGWFNTTLGSAVADFIMPQNTNPSSAVSAALCISDGTTANRAVIAVSALANTARAVLTINPTTVPLTFGTISAANTVTKEAIAWDGTTLYASINGSAVVTGGPIGTPPGMNTVTIGNLSGPTPDYLNGWVQRIRYWPRVLSSTELQTVST